jgi:hypothetical protein
MKLINKFKISEQPNKPFLKDHENILSTIMSPSPSEQNFNETSIDLYEMIGQQMDSKN